MHDTLTIGLPILAILAGILFNRVDHRDTRQRIDDLRSEMMRRFDRVDADLRTFYSITGKLDGRVDELFQKALIRIEGVGPDL